MRSASLSTMTTATRSAVVPRPRPEDISWRTMGGLLVVQIDLRNDSSEPTEPDELVIDVAPLGAFVPFKPGTRIAVPALDPWEHRPVHASLWVGDPGDYRGAFSLIRHMTLITIRELEARGTPDDQEKIDALRRSLLAMRSTNWAGNLNVYFDTDRANAVEVHRARDLEVTAGEKVGFLFLLDSLGEFSSTVHASDPAWTGEVHECMPGSAVLIVHVPQRPGARASIEVSVRRNADGKTVPVTFGMEAVAGTGESLGCVTV